jgi:hypothetical protein
MVIVAYSIPFRELASHILPVIFALDWANAQMPILNNSAMQKNNFKESIIVNANVLLDFVEFLMKGMESPKMMNFRGKLINDHERRP